MEIKKIGILGAGAMGGGIAHLAASSGFEVILCDVDQKYVDGAIGRAAKLMDRQIEKQKMSAEQKNEILGRMTTTTDMADFASVDFVIEAIIENLTIKKDALLKLDQICRPGVILATNTSSMSITEIAAATSRPDKVAGMHFFNPAQVMKLVEIVRGYCSSDETINTIRELAVAFGKTTIESKKDTPGFIVNRLLFAQFLEAARMVEEGVATKEDIDIGVTMGLNHPMGLFQLMDFGSLDLAIQVSEYFFNETHDSKWTAPHTLKALVKAGRIGKKSGAGWYDYE